MSCLYVCKGLRYPSHHVLFRKWQWHAAPCQHLYSCYFSRNTVCTSPLPPFTQGAGTTDEELNKWSHRGDAGQIRKLRCGAGTPLQDTPAPSGEAAPHVVGRSVGAGAPQQQMAPGAPPVATALGSGGTAPGGALPVS